MSGSTRPKRYRHPDYAATRADYAPSLAYRVMTSASAPRAGKNFSADGRVSANPAIPGNLLCCSWCGRGGHRLISQRRRVSHPSGRVMGVLVSLQQSVVGHIDCAHNSFSRLEPGISQTDNIFVSPSLNIKRSISYVILKLN